MKRVVLATIGCLGFWLTSHAAEEDNSAKQPDKMERAKRDASNPLRMIIEASQFKARPKTPDSAASAAPTAAVVPVAAQASPSKAADVGAPRAIAERRPAPRPEPVVADAAKSAGTAPSGSGASSGGSGGITERVEPLASASNGAPGAASGMSAAVAAPAPSAPAVPDPAPQQAKAAEPPTAIEVPLKLVQYIEPEIPQRLRSRLKPNNEVTVGFRINTDGSVSEVGIRATTNHLLDSVVIDAVKQWRYGPLPEAREGTVQLVFNLGD